MQRYERLSLNLGIAALLLIAGTYVVNAMDRIVFATLLPAVSQEYGFPLAAGGFLATVFTLGLGVAGVPTGFLFDRMSRKNVAVLGIVIYSICTILTCLSVGFADMAAYRAVSGVGEAMQNAAIFTACGAYFSRNRSLALGALNVAYGIGSFIGPRWGVSLLSHSGSWRFPLYVYGIIGLIGAALVLILVSRRFTEQVIEQQERGGEAHIPDRLINRNTVLVALASIGGGLAGFGYLGLYPTFLRTSLHFSLEEAGAAASMYGAGALMGIVCGYLGDRVNQKWLTIVTLMALAVIGYSIFNHCDDAVQPGSSVVPRGHRIQRLPLRQQLLADAALRAIHYRRPRLRPRRELRLPPGRAVRLSVRRAEGSYDWGGAAVIQMSLQLIVPIIAMMFFDLSRTSSPVRHGRGTAARGRRVPDLMQDIFDYIDQHADETIAQLERLCRQPSISAQRVGLDEMAALLAAEMRAQGIETRLEDSPTGVPMVYGETGPAGSNRTLLIYNHYDVQPVDPLDAWTAPPFEPSIREGRLYARGATDNKGNIASRLAAIRAIRAVRGELPLRIKYLVEGQEEISSPGLPGFIEQHRDLLAADGCIWEDTMGRVDAPGGLAGQQGDVQGRAALPGRLDQLPFRLCRHLSERRLAARLGARHDQGRG